MSILHTQTYMHASIYTYSVTYYNHQYQLSNVNFEQPQLIQTKIHINIQDM